MNSIIAEHTTSRRCIDGLYERLCRLLEQAAETKLVYNEQHCGSHNHSLIGVAVKKDFVGKFTQAALLSNSDPRLSLSIKDLNGTNCPKHFKDLEIHWQGKSPRDRVETEVALKRFLATLIERLIMALPEGHVKYSYI